MTIKAILREEAAVRALTENSSRAAASGSKPGATGFEDAVVATLSRPGYSIAKLEKHLNNHNQGEGYLSRAGYTYTDDRRKETLDRFSQLGFAGFDAASRLLSAGFSYSRQTRMVEGLHQTAETAQSLADVARQMEEIALTD